MQRPKDIARLQFVFTHRERRAQQSVIDRRRELDGVLHGLAGACELKVALETKMRRPAAMLSSVAELSAAQSHAALLGRQLQEVERLEQRAQLRCKQLRQQLVECKRLWQRAQSRQEHAQTLGRKLQRTQALRCTEAREEDAAELWLMRHRENEART